MYNAENVEKTMNFVLNEKYSHPKDENIKMILDHHFGPEIWLGLTDETKNKLRAVKYKDFL
jgi:hypothetical protein